MIPKTLEQPGNWHLGEILGHASVNVTLNRYVHSSIDQKRKYMEQLPLLQSGQ